MKQGPYTVDYEAAAEMPPHTTGCVEPAEEAPAGLWRGALRYLLVALVLAALVWVGLGLHGHDAYGPLAALAVLSGALFGFVLQRSRFCFFCIFRDLLEKHDARPMMGILAALAVGTAGYAVALSARIPDATAGWLPLDAFIGPAGWHLVLGGAIFGLGMALSGSCISAHLYRIGEGSLLAPIALLGSVGGFIAAYHLWNPLYLRVVADAPVIWIPAWWGYAVAVLLQLGVLAVLAVAMMPLVRPAEPGERTGGDPATLAEVLRAVFQARWPAWIGGVCVGLISAFVYMRTSTPLGVTAELNRLSRGAAETAGIMPPRLEGLDGLRGCIPPAADQWISQNGIFVLSLVAGALVAGLLAGQFRPRRESPRACLMALLGGALLGMGAMISLGCTIGTLLSGIHALALAGWIFLGGALAGTWLGLFPRRWLLS